MPVIDIKNGKFIEKSTKTKTSAEALPEETEKTEDNKWFALLTSKFNLILIGIIILLVFLLYRSYTNE